MTRFILPVLTCIIFLFSTIQSIELIETLDEAKSLSAASGKPILIEFYREDCEYCAKAAEEEQRNTDIQDALKDFLYVKLCVQYGEGEALVDTYKVGSTFPLYIVANARGEVISRWAGFGGAQRQISSLKTALRDQTSVEERTARFQSAPNFRDALVLAKYYSDSQQNEDAVKYYRLAEKYSKGGRADYSYQIFSNTANLVWYDTWSFDSVLKAADAVMENKLNTKDIINCVTVLCRVARRADKTDELKPYMYAALEATNGTTDESLRAKHYELAIDTILYITKDIGAALRVKEATLGDNWQNDPKKFYPYTRWCLEREINLVKAEQFARTAVDRVNPGAFKAQVLHTLACILDIRGKYDEAVRFIELATQEDPANSFYASEYDRILADWSTAESKK
ncbi:MAG: thioredoxin family protein [Candidatus Zixiibacteriota bacterium]